MEGYKKDHETDYEQQWILGTQQRREIYKICESVRKNLPTNYRDVLHEQAKLNDARIIIPNYSQKKIEKEIKYINPKKATEFDLITGETLKIVLKVIKTKLTYFTSASYRHKFVLKVGKVAVALTISNKG